MKENMTESAAAQGAEARTQQGATAADLGKFKDVNALLQAYNSLEAEFTRRSQRLRELEEKVAAAEQGSQPSAQTAGRGEQGAGADGFAASVAEAVEAYIASRPPAVLAGGGTFAPAPAPRVRSLEEAGRLAREWMEKEPK